jgi:hypothetical protein
MKESEMVKSLLCRIGAGLLGLAMSLSVAAQAGHQHAPAAKARSDLGASAALDSRSGDLWAVYKEGDHVLLRRSADDGRTWSAAQPVNRVPEKIAAEGDARPKIALGGNGEIYVTWTTPLSKPYTGNIRFARSLDAGRSFSEPIIVHADRQEITHRFDALAVDREGRIFIAWIDKRDLVAMKTKVADKDAYRGAAVYYAVSDDRGTSFRGDYKLADHSCECCRISLFPAQGGGVLAMWRHVFAPNIRDHALAHIDGQGKAGAMRRVTFDDWRIDACPHHGPSVVAASDGTLHAVWFTEGERRNGVFYGRLGDGAVEGLRRIGGDTAAHADVAVIGSRVAVAWKEFDGQRTQLRAVVSADGGHTWGEHSLAATEGASGQPIVLAHGDRFLVFWHTRQQPLSVVAIP